MSVTSETQQQSASRPGLAGRLDSVRRTMERPLTSYYLLLGGTAMLLAIGLMMVLSASSVYSYENHHGNSYYIFLKQLTWVVIGAAGRLAGQPDEPPVPAAAGLALGAGRGRAAAR